MTERTTTTRERLTGRQMRDAYASGRRDFSRCDLYGAVLRDADLTGADLRGAILTDAVLRGADLTGADLRGAILTRAYLWGANLTGAYLWGADLTDAVLTDADLTGADLRGAILTDAVLTDAVLTGADICAVLATAPAEASAVLAALEAGRIKGSSYEDAMPDGTFCGCLVGTIAHTRGVRFDAIPGLVPDSSRPAERWFLLIRPGDTPENSSVAAQTAEWISAWIAEHETKGGTAG